MAIVLGQTQYGKAETRLVRVYRDTDRHALACHFVDDIAMVNRAHVDVNEYRWERVSVAGAPHAHTFIRAGHEVRTATATIDASGPVKKSWVVPGVKDLVLLKSTGSEFTGFLKDRYTTLAETTDWILATALIARWRYLTTDVAWDDAFGQVRRILLERFAQVHSRALQQTLWEMGSAVLAARDDAPPAESAWEPPASFA